MPEERPPHRPAHYWIQLHFSKSVSPEPLINSRLLFIFFGWVSFWEISGGFLMLWIVDILPLDGSVIPPEVSCSICYGSSTELSILVMVRLQMLHVLASKPPMLQQA